MPLPMSTACMHIEENDGSVFVIPSSKKNQSPIIFGRVWHRITTSNDSDEDLDPDSSSLCAVSTLYDERNGIRLSRDEGLNFIKGWRIPLQPFAPKGKPANYYNQTRRGLGYITPSAQSDPEFERLLLSHSSDSSKWKSDISVGVAFKKLFVNMVLTSQVEPEEDIELFDMDTWAQQLDLQEALWTTRSSYRK